VGDMGRGALRRARIAPRRLDTWPAIFVHMSLRPKSVAGDCVEMMWMRDAGRGGGGAAARAYSA
jgi:hypothetical protein